MSESKHDPGPWIDGNDGGSIIAPNSLKPMSDTERKYYGGVLVAETVCSRNAALIKSAPDLLEALEELGDWLAYGLEKPDGARITEEDERRCAEVAAKARAAIDKAKGEK